MKSKTFRRTISLLLCVVLVASMFTMSFSAFAATGFRQEGDLTIYDWDFTDTANGQDYADEMDADSVKFDPKGGAYSNLYGYNADTGAYEIDTSAGVPQQHRGYAINNPSYATPQSFTLVGGGLADYKDRMLRPGVIFASDENGYYGLLASCKNGLFFKTVYYYSYKNGSYTSVNNPSQSGMEAMYIATVNEIPVIGDERELSRLTERALTAANTILNCITWTYQVDVDENDDIIVVVTADYDDGLNQYSFVSQTFTFNLDVLLNTPTVGAAMAKSSTHLRFGPRFGFFSMPVQPRDYYSDTDQYPDAPDQSNQATQIYSIYAEYADIGDACIHETIETVGAEDATCEEEGYTGDVVCSDCEAVLQEGKVIDALGHAWKETERVDATIYEDGYYKQICSRCTKEEKVTLDRLEAYTVTFVGEGETVLDEQTVGEGLSATAPADPESIFGYEFIGWDTDFSKVTSDLTVRAVFFDPDEFTEGYTFDFNLKETSATDVVRMEHLSVASNVNGTYNTEEGGYVLTPTSNALYFSVIENPLHTNLVSTTVEGYRNSPGIVFAQDENGYYMYRITFDLMNFRRNVVYYKKNGTSYVQRSLLLNQVSGSSFNPKLATVVAIDDQPLTTPTQGFCNKQSEIGYAGIGSSGRLTADQLYNFSISYSTYVEYGEITISTIITYDDGEGTIHTYTLENETFSLEMLTDEANDYADKTYLNELSTVTHDEFDYVLGFYTSTTTVSDYTSETIITYVASGYEEYDENNCKHDRRDWVTDGYYYDCVEGGETGNTSCGFCGADIAESQTIPAKGAHVWRVTHEADGIRYYECYNCDATDEEVLCAHEETELQKAKTATCTENGYTGDEVCKSCGVAAKKGSVIPATGHTANGAGTVTEPNCTDKGYTSYTCKTCGQNYKSEEKNALGHDEITTITKAETCTEKGEKTISCSRCDFKETAEIPATGHDTKTETTKEATCTEKGEAMISCSRCDFKETKEIEALGHDTKTETTKEATCTEKGETMISCSRCDFKETAEIPATGHTEGDWVTVKDPTTKEPGLAEKKCTVCEEVLETKELEVLEPEGVYGDFDGDGKADIADAIYVARHASGLADIPEGRFGLVDVNGDGNVNVSDAVLIARFSSGLIGKFPVEA